MTSALSTRQRLLTKAANRLSLLLNDVLYQPQEEGMEMSVDIEERKIHVRNEQLRLRKARKVIEMEEKNVESALEAYNEEANNLTADTPQISDILEKVKAGSTKAEDLLEKAQSSRTKMAEQLEEKFQSSDSERTYKRTVPPKTKPQTPGPQTKTRAKQHLISSAPVEQPVEDVGAVLCMKNTAISGSTKGIVLVGEARLLNEKTNTLERVHLLLDTGAVQSFINKDLADKLQLKDLHTLTLKISTFGSQKTMEKKCGVSTLQIYDCMGRAHQFSVARVEHLTEEIHRQKLSEEDKRYLIDNDIELSVRRSIERVQPQVLLGLIPSRLGYLITGQTTQNRGNWITTLNPVIMTEQNEDQSWEQFLALESVGINEFPEVAHELASNVYVDNVILSASDEEHAILKYEASKALFGEMKMNLRGFQTNNTHFNDPIPQQDRSAQKVTNVPGILWDSNEDTIRIHVRMPERAPTTKRTVSEQIATVYDPMGWLTPLMLRSKLFLQFLWKSDCN
ncbi:hypothetical protein ANCCAN_18198 [Ancylostoma caninum]|uniref:Peptidase A2 domain-containing protein n=1 Tax=Ancylostoma caninum TaxID=29170 RepID=A0A368FYW9_ANCCA|nr:hypothetical protein ANCCAN_18198 [Ancylostoma caninum]